MKALVVLSAVVAVVLSAPSVDKRYVRTYVPWQPNRYYNSYNPVRNVYNSSPRWYQSTVTPLKYEASTLSPWQGKAKFSFGSVIASTPAAAVKPEAEQKVQTIIVESAPAVPKVPAGFGAFHFGKKSTPIVVEKQEIKPIEIVAPEIKITQTSVESSGSAEASFKSISNEESNVKNVEVDVSEVKPVVVETVSVQSLPKTSAGALVEDSQQSQLIVTSEAKSQETLNKLDVEKTSENLNKTSLAIEKPSLVEEPKPLSIVENQSISEIKSQVITPVVTKKKHGFSFSYNPSLNVYNRDSLNSQAQPPAASVPEVKPQVIVIQAIQPAIELKPTLPATAEPEIATITPTSSTIEALQATTENIELTNDYVVPTLDISQPIIQYNQYSSDVSEQNAENPSTIEYVVPTAVISQPIIQYGSPSEENPSTTIEPAQSTTESSLASSEYASEYSAINSESIDALLLSLDATIEPADANIKPTANDYLPTEFESSATENAPITTESASNENLQIDIEPALTTVQSQPANVEPVPAIESSAPLVSQPLILSVQSESAAAIASQSSSYSSTSSILKKKHGFSFSYNPSGYVYNKEASFAYKPSSEVSAPEISASEAVSTLAPITVQSVQPVVSTVIPAVNVWSNSYNPKKNSFSFSYNPTFSYFNKQQLNQPQIAVPASPAAVILSVPSAAPEVSSPSVIQSSASYVQIAPLAIESTPAAQEIVESTTVLIENSPKNAESIITESSQFETTTLINEYVTNEVEEKAPTELELPSTTAETNDDLATQSPTVESSNLATESLSSKNEYTAAPLLISASPNVGTPVAAQVLPAPNSRFNTYNTKKNGYSFSSFPSFSYFNKPAYQSQVAVIAPAPSTSSFSSTSPVLSGLASIETSSRLAETSAAAIGLSLSPESAPLEVAKSTPVLSEISTENDESKSTTESYSDEITTLATESNESFSTTQIATASIELVAASIESSIKEALNEQHTIENASTAIKSENVTQSSSISSSVTSSASIESAPAAIASVQAIPVPVYVKEETKVSPPPVLPAFQPTFVTKKHGFSFSHKPSGNYYNKPVAVASYVAPAIVESSPAIASVAPAIVESSPVIAAAAPAVVESSAAIASAAPAVIESSPVIASAAPVVVESSAAIASAAPAVLESSPVIASAAPVVVESSATIASAVLESSPVIASAAPTQENADPSVLLSLFNTVKSVTLEEEATEKVVEAKPEVALVPTVLAEPQKLNSEAEPSSEYDIKVKASPISTELKEEAEIIHDLRLGF